MPNPQNNDAVNHIEINDPENKGKVKVVSDRETMESTMMTKFKTKLMEVNITPIVHELFLSIICPDELSPVADKF